LNSPAATGLFHKQYATIGAKNQWAKLNGNPKDIYGIYEIKLSKLNGGIGVNYEYDNIGFSTTNKINLNYAYHHSISETKTLSIGTSLGLNVFEFEPSWTPPDTYNDPSLPTYQKDQTYNLNLGIMYKTPRFLIGFNTYQLTESTSRKINFKNRREYYLTSSYSFNLGSNFELKPMINVILNNIDYIANINLIASYKKQFWGGLLYQTSNASGLVVGYDFKERYRVNYAIYKSNSALFNSKTSINSFSAASHEFGIAFMLD
jgi:type IX secretion system PorP/SprF family membrane protein